MNKNDISKKLQDAISGANNMDINKAKQNIEKLINSPQGESIMRNISQEDKDKLLKKFMSIDNEKIRKSLQNLKASDLNGLQIDEILKKLR